MTAEKEDSATPASPASAQPVAPKGWKLVPIEPDLKMVIAAENYIGRHAWGKMIAVSPAPEPVSQPVVAVPEGDAIAMLRYVLPYIPPRALDLAKARTGPMEDAYINTQVRRFIEQASTPLAAPVEQDKQDAARYRVLRKHVAPRDVTISMRIPFEDIPPNQTICERIDMLCDQELKKANGEAAP